MCIRDRAGTGKTQTVQTTIQEIYRVLEEQGVPMEFIRCAAPTGCAAFNLKFNATTIHRLIHWTNIKHFQELKETRLSDFQEFMMKTNIIFLDEVSMIGRKMMARVDSRLQQGKGSERTDDEFLGGVSCVCIGDPAQCESGGDQQFYDERLRNDHSIDGSEAAARLSNVGLSVYDTFDEVVILTQVHRQSQHKDPGDDAEKLAYNERSQKYWDIIHKLRESDITVQEYMELCRRKHAYLKLSEKQFFMDAPVLMDFRRITDANPEANCNYFNQQKLRAHAPEKKLPVVAFDALHEGCTQSHGMCMTDEHFMGLPPHLEICAGAPVLLIHNLATEHGLMNGSQGKVKEIQYADGDHPNHSELRRRMPCSVIVDFPEYVGPPFFEEADRRTLVPLLPRTLSHKEENEYVERTMYPLTLAWALTPWKAQGMTLNKLKVKLGSSVDRPGVLFTSLTRIRHPDTLMLDDNFPSYGHIMKARSHEGFALRQQWERRARVKFSRTIRRHMRDPKVYSEHNVWTAEESTLADAMLEALPSTTGLDITDFPELFLKDHSATPAEEAHRVWSKMQRFPHMFEIHATRDTLHTLKLDGTPDTTPQVSKTLTPLRCEGWSVHTAFLNELRSFFVLRPEVLEWLAQSLRARVDPARTCFLRPDQLQKQRVSPHMLWKRFQKEPSSLPEWTFLPYISTASRHWALYVLHRDETGELSLIHI